MQRQPSRKLPHLKSSVSVAMLVLGSLTVATIVSQDLLGGAALAQHDEGGGGHDGGDDHEGGDDHGGSGGSGPGQPGGNPNPGGSGQGGGGGHDGGQGGGHDTDPDGNPTQPGGASDDRDNRGGRPVWAREGIPDVELGRLSVARSPDVVLDRAFTEALASLTPDMVNFYNLTLDEAIDALRAEFDDLSIIDSPLQNLALLRDALDGSSALSSFGVTSSVNTLIPIFLGVASDKTLEITPEVAYAVSYILGFELTAAQATVLAEQADAVRSAVLEGHG